MREFDLNKVSAILEIVKEALDKQDEYRFASDLIESELVFLKKHVDVEEIEDFGTITLYKLTSKKAA